MITKDVLEKLILVCSGVLLTFVLQITVATIRMFWDWMCIRQQLYLFGCSLVELLIDGEVDDTEWLAKNMVTTFSAKWRSKGIREDFFFLLGIYLFARKSGYDSLDAKKKESDIERIRDVIKKYGRADGRRK
jgi:hypothetical protein